MQTHTRLDSIHFGQKMVSRSDVSVKQVTTRRKPNPKSMSQQNARFWQKVMSLTKTRTRWKMMIWQERGLGKKPRPLATPLLYTSDLFSPFFPEMASQMVQVSSVRLCIDTWINYLQFITTKEIITISITSCYFITTSSSHSSTYLYDNKRGVTEPHNCIDMNW